ncbi:PTS system mannose/fructose/sorbose family transporter subunit IID [Escherichia coli]|nr:PTS system mannose/fructose/sorbose family transporter subunit IID [Escherichia coli]
MASNQTTLPNVSENEETLLTGVNENVYEDQSIGAELTKKDINRVAWRSMLLPICGGIGASLALQGSILGAVVFIVLFNVVHLGLRFGLAHYAYRMGVAAIPLIKANTKKVGHAASIVGMTVIGALVATYVRLSTTLEITAGDAVVKLQADVIDKLMPAFLPLVYTLTMFWLVRRGWSPLRLIAVTVVLGIVGKFCHFL